MYANIAIKNAKELSTKYPISARTANSNDTTTVGLYQSSNWVTDNYPVSTRDRHDFPGLVNQRVPGIAAVVEDIVGGFEHAV